MKIDRALIIRRLKIKDSIEYAAMCAASCEKHGIPYEYIDGIEFMSSEDAFKTVGVWLNPEQKNLFRGRGVSVGNNNCHASHIKAWRRIVELDKACVIFEHDMVVKGNITNIDIHDMAINIMGLRVGNEAMYEPIGPIKEMVRIPCNTGGHAYALTPKTAQWFIDDAEKNGVLTNVDELINSTCKLPLYLANPPQAVCWPRMSTREWQQEDKPYGTPGPTSIDIRSTTPEFNAGFKALN